MFTIKTAKNSCEIDHVLYRKPSGKELFTSAQAVIKIK